MTTTTSAGIKVTSTSSSTTTTSTAIETTTRNYHVRPTSVSDTTRVLALTSEDIEAMNIHPPIFTLIQKEQGKS